MSKSLFKSKTFWFNALTAGLEVWQMVAPILPVPPGTLTLVVNLGNVILRRLSEEPVHVLTPRDK